MFLILHLKRFIWVEKPIVTAVGSDENAEPNSQPCRTEYVFKKKQDPVELSEVVDLAPFRAPQVECNSSSAKYSLKSIVYHHGMRAESGHYSTDALRSLPPGTVQADGSTTTEATPVWVEFDDTSTSLTSLEKIVSAKFKQERAYILLYCLD
jgi:ubiquitin carboxyl-terminal hydrolase 10